MSKKDVQDLCYQFQEESIFKQYNILLSKVDNGEIEMPIFSYCLLRALISTMFHIKTRAEYDLVCLALLYAERTFLIYDDTIPLEEKQTVQAYIHEALSDIIQSKSERKEQDNE